MAVAIFLLCAPASAQSASSANRFVDLTKSEKALFEAFLNRARKFGIIRVDLDLDFDMQLVPRPSHAAPTLLGCISVRGFDSRTPGMPAVDSPHTLHGVAEPRWELAWKDSPGGGSLDLTRTFTIAVSRDLLAELSPFNAKDVPVFIAVVLHELQHVRHQHFVLGEIERLAIGRRLKGDACVNFVNDRANAFFRECSDFLKTSSDGDPFQEPPGNQANEAFAYYGTFLLLADAYPRILADKALGGRYPDLANSIRRVAREQFVRSDTAFGRAVRRLEELKAQEAAKVIVELYVPGAGSRSGPAYPWPVLGRGRTARKVSLYMGPLPSVPAGKDALDVVLDGDLSRFDPSEVAFELD